MNDPTPTPEPPDDRFSLFFNRLVRITGLGIALYETIVENADRPYLLGLAGTMMSGSLLADALIKRRRDS